MLIQQIYKQFSVQHVGVLCIALHPKCARWGLKLALLNACRIKITQNKLAEVFSH